jgi:hypothetical protein
METRIPDTYTARFEQVERQTLLSLVLEFAGLYLQHPCMVRFIPGDLSRICSKPSPKVAQIVPLTGFDPRADCSYMSRPHKHHVNDHLDSAVHIVRHRGKVVL